LTGAGDEAPDGAPHKFKKPITAVRDADQPMASRLDAGHTFPPISPRWLFGHNLVVQNFLG